VVGALILCCVCYFFVAGRNRKDRKGEYDGKYQTHQSEREVSQTGDVELAATGEEATPAE